MALDLPSTSAPLDPVQMVAMQKRQQLARALQNNNDQTQTQMPLLSQAYSNLVGAGQHDMGQQNAGLASVGQSILGAAQYNHAMDAIAHPGLQPVNVTPAVNSTAFGRASDWLSGIFDK